MPDLAACFQGLGFSSVRTYIQSGNVVFGTNYYDSATLARQIEEALSETFHYEASLVLRSHDEMKAIITDAPEGFGSNPATYRYDVIYLKEPLTAQEVMLTIKTREGVDQAAAGEGVLYFSRLIQRASQSYLTRIVGQPIYQSMTIRNWNTTTRLLELMGEIKPAA